MQEIPISTVSEEGVYRASKYQRVQMLLEQEELEGLFNELNNFYILEYSKVLEQDNHIVSKEEFLLRYKTYLTALKTNPKNITRDLLSSLSVTFSKNLDVYYQVKINDQKTLIKLKAPAILVQPFTFHLDLENESVFTSVHTEERIFWGLEFSFPGVYQDGKTIDVIEIFKDLKSPNTTLFKTLQKYARRNTTPTSLLFKDSSKNFSFRLGKKCYRWINEYSKLHEHNLIVGERENRNSIDRE